MVVWTPLPKTIREAKTLQVNSAGRVTAGSDATDGDIEVSVAAPVMDKTGREGCATLSDGPDRKESS